MDYEVQRCTRHCAVTGRELAEGEEFFSILTADGTRVVRQDYSLDVWTGPPDGVVSWWKSKIPNKEAKKAASTPSEALLDLFREFEGQDHQIALRYALALLLIRRRLLRLEDTETDDSGVEHMILFCPRDNATERVRVEQLTDEQVTEIESRLSALLQNGAPTSNWSA